MDSVKSVMAAFPALGLSSRASCSWVAGGHYRQCPDFTASGRNSGRPCECTGTANECQVCCARHGRCQLFW